MNDRIKWSDTEWALHLGVKPEQMPELKKAINKNFLAYVAQTIKSDQQDAPVFADGKWHLCLDRRHDTPSGMERWLSMATFNDGFNTAKEAAEDANNRIIPNLEMNELRASLMGIPKKAFQLLQVNTK